MSREVKDSNQMQLEPEGLYEELTRLLQKHFMKVQIALILQAKENE